MRGFLFSTLFTAGLLTAAAAHAQSEGTETDARIEARRQTIVERKQAVAEARTTADATKPKEELKEVVFVLENGKAKPVPVQTGISDFDHIEILGGLTEGQKVISGPFKAVSKTLKAGDLVVVKSAEDLAKELKGDGGGPPQ